MKIHQNQADLKQTNEEHGVDGVVSRINNSSMCQRNVACDVET